MGFIHANIELVSLDDLALERRGYIKAEEVRSVRVEALVDTGAYMLCVNEKIKRELDLVVKGTQKAELADGRIEKYEIVGPIEIRFENRYTSCNALVFPGEAEVLLGAIPMEDLDVVLNPLEQRMTVNPESPQMAKKKVKATAGRMRLEFDMKAECTHCE